MSTSTDGAAPPVTPGDGEPAAGSPRRRRAAGPEDSGPHWLQEELRRRIDANTRTGRGRHARDEADTDQFGVETLAARMGGPAAPAVPAPPPVLPAAFPPVPAPHPAEPAPQSYLDYDDYDDDYDGPEDYDDDEDVAFTSGEVARFERVLGPASVPLRMPPPEAYDDGRTSGGMRGYGAPAEPGFVPRTPPAGLSSPPAPLHGAPHAATPMNGAPHSATTAPLGGTVSTAPLGGPTAAAPPAAPPAWPGMPVPGAIPAVADPERTDVGGIAPVAPHAPAPAESPARPQLSARTAAAPAGSLFAAPVEGAEDTGLGRPRGARFPDSRTELAEEAPRRVRVVLSERKGNARTVRTVVDVQEGTAVGELLRGQLIGGQLAVALRIGAIALLFLGVLPVLFAVYPELGQVEVLGLRLPWLLLGVLVYPFMLLLGWWHTRAAEKVEQSFADHVQD